MKECVVTVSYWMYCLLVYVLTFSTTYSRYWILFFILSLNLSTPYPRYGLPFFFILNEVADFNFLKREKKKWEIDHC